MPLTDGQNLFDSLDLDDEQDAICTRDDDCAALADAHHESCPVEQKLREELGY